ncbi:MAG: ABC transporter permease [Acidobacteria bacterium]|nr:ABC transporter permease [Acidobacteriota bacterium]
MFGFRKPVRRFEKKFFKSRFDANVCEEPQFHPDSMIQENARNGRPQEQAPRGARILGEIGRDLLYGFRMMRKNPGLMSVAVMILAIGIGANTAIIGFVDAVIFRPPPIPLPDKVLSSPMLWSWTDFADIRKNSQSHSDFAAHIAMTVDPRDSQGFRRSTRAISFNYFNVIGLPMAAGRSFLPEEEDLSSLHRVAVISFRYWQQAYHSDPAAVGKSLLLNGEQLTIVGVAPKNFKDLLGESRLDVWVPIPIFFKIIHADINKLEVNYGQVRTIHSRDLRALTVFARLKQDISAKQATELVLTLVMDLQRAYPDTNKDWNTVLTPIDNARWPGRESLFPYALLMGTGICVLLIACMNVANLLLAHGSARIREIAVRSSLGAGRLRILRQLLTEGLVLSTASVIAGLAVCALAIKSFPIIARTLGISPDLELAIDGRILVFSLCLGLLTNILFGLAPALVVSRTDIGTLTKYQDSFCLPRIGSKWRQGLVVLQIALSVTLLIAAGLFVRAVLRIQTTDIGYDRAVLLFSPDIISLQYDPKMLRPDTVLSFYRQSLDRIRELPGILSASWADDLPLDRIHMAEEIVRDPSDTGRDSWQWCNSVSSSYFKTIGTPILQGRDFTDREDESAPHVVIINETLARRFWPTENPIGKYLFQKALNRKYEVIGVVKDAKYGVLNEKPVSYAYFHYAQAMMTFHMDLHVRTTEDSTALADSIRNAFRAIDPRMAIEGPQLMSEHLDKAIWQERAAVLVFGLLGPLSLILAGIGLYGIISYSTIRRSREFGIRIALGARRNEILRLIFWEGMISAVLGLAIGLPLSMAAARIIASRFQEVRPADPITYGSIILLCFAVSAAATLLPARKAHLNPWSSLRNE